MTPEEIAAMQAENASMKARVAELEPDAKVGAQQRAADAKRVKEAAEKLSPEKRALVEAAPPELRAKLVEALYIHPPAAGAGGGPPPPPLDFDSAWGKPEWSDAKARDPGGASAWLRSKINAATGGVSPLAFLRGK